MKMNIATACRIAGSAAIALSLTSAAFAATVPSSTSADQKALMKTCNTKATAQALNGAARKAFMKSCLTGKSTAATSPQASLAPVPAPAIVSALPTAPAKAGWHSTAGTPLAAVATHAKPAGVTSAASLAGNQFAGASQAQAHCPSATVVWVNGSSKVYHYAGYSEYGKTKASSYMCEADAKAAGNRAAKDEKAPLH